MLEPPAWAGDKLYFLAIETTTGAAEGNYRPLDARIILIDLDEPGWVAKHADLMRTPGVWHLVHKGDSRIPFSMILNEGEQGYCLIRHIGVMGATKAEVSVYGIGKVRVDGHTDRLWVLPNGQVCGGDDAEPLAKAYLRMRTLSPAGQPAQAPKESDMDQVRSDHSETEHETGSTSVDRDGAHDATVTSTSAKSTTGRVEDQTVKTPEPGKGSTTGDEDK